MFSAVIRSRGACERCGRTDTLQCAHIVGRRNKTLRWDPHNALCLCHYCHNEWGHKHKRQFEDWVQYKYSERWEYIQQEKHKTTKRTLEDYQILYKHYKTLLDRLKAEF